MRVTVLITSFNQRQFLIEAIESVLAQTRPADEILILDDGSTDGSRDVMAEYAGRFPHLVIPYFHERNLGIAQNRNFGFERATGDFVTSLDGDDRYLPGKLAAEVAALERAPEARIVFSNFRYIAADGSPLESWCEPGQSPPTGWVFPEVFGRAFPRGSLFRCELIDRKSLLRIGLMDSSFPIYEDWEHRIRLTHELQVTWCPEVLSEYRQHGGGLSRAPAELHYEMFRRIYAKNAALLDSAQRRDVDRRLGPAFRRFARTAAVEAANRGLRASALRYYIRSLGWDPFKPEPRLLLRILAPRTLKRFIRACNDGLRG